MSTTLSCCYPGLFTNCIFWILLNSKDDQTFADFLLQPHHVRKRTLVSSRYQVVNIKGMLHVPFYLTHMPHALKWDHTALKQILISNSISANSFRPDKQEGQPPPPSSCVFLTFLVHMYCYFLLQFVRYGRVLLLRKWTSLVYVRPVMLNPFLISVCKRFTV